MMNARLVRVQLVLVLITAVTLGLVAQGTIRGVQLFEAHDRVGAKTEFLAALERNDRDASAHYYLGRLAMIDGDIDVAAAHFDRAVKLDGNVSDYQFWYGSAVGQQAGKASKLKQPFLARRVKSAVERAVELDGRNLDARDLLVDFYSMAPGIMGGSAEKARDQAQAIARLDAMRGHLAVGRIASRANDTTIAQREMNSAIAAAPDSLRGYTALATWYLNEKRWPQAFATWDRYIERRPDDPYGPYGVGRIAAASGEQLARGEQGIRAFIAKPPKDAASPTLSRAYLRLGQILERQGKRAEARSAFEQAVKIDPRNEDAKKEMK